MCSKLLIDYIRDEGYPVATLILTLLGTTFTVIRTALIIIVVHFVFNPAAGAGLQPQPGNHSLGSEVSIKKILGSLSILIGLISLLQGVYIWKAASKDDSHSATKGMCIGLIVLIVSGICFVVSAWKLTFLASITLSFLFDISRVIVETYSVSQALIQYQKPFQQAHAFGFY